MGPTVRCGGLMRAVFDAAASGDRRAQSHALAVCELCPERVACLRRSVTNAPWPDGQGPTGVVAGLVITGRARRSGAKDVVVAGAGGFR